MFLLISCLQYEGIRCMIGRARLNAIKRTTLKTFIDICKSFGFDDYNINYQNNTIVFGNGSEIVLVDMYNYPNDPDYERLGSSEYTYAFLDELSEISYKGFQVLTSRLRYKHNEFNLTPKLFCASNPTQNWSKTTFYLPYVENRELPHVSFIPALPSDNPHLPENYLELMNRTLDHTLKQRLLYGNWDFDNDEANLFNYDKLQQAFYNDELITTSDVYICVDVADLGSDKTVISIWRGWRCVKLIKLSKKETTEIVTEINKYRIDYQVPIKNIIIDSIGVGAGVASLLKGCIRYMGSHKPTNTGYRNMKTQLMYKFAEMINNLDVHFMFPYSDDIIQEAILHKKEFSNLVASVTPKDNIKSQLGRSPDTIDSLYLRAYWEIQPKKKSIIRVL